MNPRPLEARQSKTRPLDAPPSKARPVETPSANQPSDHRLRWPETLALTVLLLLAVVVAAGWAGLPDLLP